MQIKKSYENRRSNGSVSLPNLMWEWIRNKSYTEQVPVSNIVQAILEEKWESEKEEEE